ncbi:hypothetical protein HRbin36_02204 [bacterium HR36]|nr:hypothetical protein HRbin36_02204 [bacterium HR36]
MLPTSLASTATTDALSPTLSTRTWLMDPPSARWLLRWLIWSCAVVVSVALAFWGGRLVGRWRAASVPPASDTPAGEETSDQFSSRLALGVTAREQEEALLVLVRVTERPEKDSAKLRQGVQHRVDLAVLLLRSYGEDPPALDRAERLFREWQHSPVEAYALVGDIGLAMVLAFRDHPTESNERFLTVLKRCPGLQRPAFGLTPFLQPEWYRLVVRALEHNRTNCVAQGLTFPNELARLRQELPAKPRLTKPAS